MEHGNIERIRRKPRRELVRQLFELRGENCPICGKLLDPLSCTIDHILPMALGGNDEIDNLQLLCHDCNCSKGTMPFLGYQFEEYINQLLDASPKYSRVDYRGKFSGARVFPDVVCERLTDLGPETIVAEVTVSHSFTEDRVLRKIEQLRKYQEHFPNAKLALVTPGELPQKYVEQIRENGIELWDRTFISKEFRNQIQTVKPSSFSLFFDIPTDDVDEFQSLINELHACMPGTTEWGKYQKFVGKILEFLFCPPLNLPLPQNNDKAKKNRRDFILPNYAQENDSWAFLRNRYGADYVVVDAKNSGKNITKQDVLQIGNYLKKDGAGLFGIIIARKGLGEASENALREMWLYEHKMIVVLNDYDIEQMILEKKNKRDPSKLILKKIEDFRLLI